MVQENNRSYNGAVPVQDNLHAMMPDGAAFDQAPPIYPPCASDYEAPPVLKASAPTWRNEHPKYVHSMEWHDSLGIKHMLVFRDDDLDAVLREARTIREFVKAARARDEKPDMQIHMSHPEPEQGEQADSAPSSDSAYDAPERRVWCDRHHAWMHLREKNGSSWYSHKTAEGWCRRGMK